MRWRAVSSIFGKELTETLRDRRTLFALIVLPILLQPLLMMAFGELVASEQAARQGIEPNLVLWGPVPEVAEHALQDKLKAKVVARLPAIPADAEGQSRALIAKGEADVIVAALPEAATAFSSDGTAMIQLYYDSVGNRSGAAHERVEDVLDEVRNSELTARIARRALPAAFDKPLLYAQHDLASKENKGGDFAGRVLPMVLLLMVLLGAIYPAIDMTAGEKERGTMQTLLCAPVRPVEIVAGKYLVVVLIALTSAAVNLAAMGFALSRQIAAVDAKSMQFALGPRVFVAVFAAMIPAALLLSALLLGMAVFARSFREAQTYLTPVVTALIVPGFVATLPSVGLDPVMALIPVVNLALLLRDLLRGDATTSMYVLVTTASMAYAAMAIFFAARVFESEQVLLGGEQPWSDVFGRRDVAQATPRPGTAVLFVAVLLVTVYYGSLFADPARLGVVGGVAAIQLGLLLAPVLLAAKFSGVDFKATFSLRPLTPRALAGTLLLASGAWSLGSVVGAAESALFPGTAKYFEELMKSLGGGTEHLPVAVAVLLLAGLPAIAEEACFRGFVMSGLANTGSRTIAVVGSAVAFGLLHLSPYHIVPAAAVGLALGFATLESGSIFAGACVHFVNNALGVTAERVPAVRGLLESNTAIGLGLLLTVAGLALLRGSRASAPASGLIPAPVGPQVG